MWLEDAEKFIYRLGMLEGESWLSVANALKTSADNILQDRQGALNALSKDVDEDGFWSNADLFFSVLSRLHQFPIYMLLMGYAIENIFKGIIICRMYLDDPRHFDVDNFNDIVVPVKGSTQTMSINKHGLCNLLSARAMGLCFSPNEKKVLNDLDEYILWGGRYPIPKKYKPYKPHSIKTIGDISPSDEPIDIVNAIYKKSSDELSRLVSLQRRDD